MENVPTRRRRPALSCVECRRRKVKCDRVDPCAHCMAAKVPCVYKVVTLSHRGTPAGLGRSLPPHSATEAVKSSATISRRTSHASNNLQPHLTSRISEPTQRCSSPTRNGIALPKQRVEHTSSDPSRGGASLLTIELNGEITFPMKKTRVAAWSDRMGNDLFSNIFECYREASGTAQDFSEDVETMSVVTEIGDLLRRSKRLARDLKANRPPQMLGQAVTILALPSREVADTLAELYFSNFESTHRVLHMASFWANYQRYWAGEVVPDEVRLTLLLVIAIGSSLSEHHRKDHSLDAQVRQWVYAAQSWLSGPFEKSHMSLGALQLYCLTLLARQVLAIGSDLTWVSVGALLNQAFQMGLHRDPSKLPDMGLLQAEIRRRLWATIVDLVIQSSLDTALHPRISTEDFDVALPSNFDDCDLVDSIAASPPKEDTVLTDTTVQRLLTRSIPLRLRILKLLNSLDPELYYPDVVELSQEVSNVCKSCSAALKKHGASQFRSNLLDYLQRRFLLPLHCVFANQARSQPLFYYSLKVSLDTAATIVLPAPDQKFLQLMTVAGGMFREGIRYASIVIALEILAQAQRKNVDSGTLPALDRALSSKLAEDLMRIAIDRIRQGETNVKHPMFLSMVMTQAKAVEEGMPSRLTMARAARDSLQDCFELLQERKHALSPLDHPETSAVSSVSFGESGDFDFNFGLEFFMPEMIF